MKIKQDDGGYYGILVTILIFGLIVVVSMAFHDVQEESIENLREEIELLDERIVELENATESEKKNNETNNNNTR